MVKNIIDVSNDLVREREMVVEVIMPKMGDMMTNGKIIKWLKEEGDKVERGEPLLEIETDKTTIEVESRGTGTLKKILIREGEVPIATTIAYIANEGETLPAELLSKPATDTAEIAKEAVAETHKPKEKPAEVEAAARVKASPLAKKLAEEKGVDLAKVTGSGPGGRITREDILAYLASKPAVAAAVSVVSPAAEGAAEALSAPEYRLVPMSSMRKAIARKMSESKMHAPHFYIGTDVDMTEAVKMRESLVAAVEAKTGVRLSFTHMIVKAVATALKEFPQLNSSLDGENIKLWRDINIGIAVGLEDGLIVPVLRGANNLSLIQIASEASKLVTKAKEKKLREEEFSGGTFTISNMGALDIESFYAIINVPETSILAVAKIADKPVAVNGQVAIRKMMNMTASVDHRVVDGVQAAKFLQKVKTILEAPYSLLLPT
jgi:pyruvate dehydrogenase E2 component (dihydrolipoamide acetyltransferase)